MYIYHETDVPYVIADKHTGQLKIKLDIEQSSAAAVRILYGDSYDYENKCNIGWNYAEENMRLKYQTGERQVWTAEIKIPKWRRIKYSFRITDANGEQYLYNEYGQVSVPEDKLAAYIDSYYSHFFYPYIYEEDMIRYPDWAEDIIWYEIFPDRFCEGGLEELITKLDYLERLGINGIYFTPLFEAKSYHKYDTVNYFQVDPQFGSNELLKQFVQRAHEKGIKVILDGVFNHISSTHPIWLDVLEKQEQSEYRDYFCISRFPVESDGEYSKALNYGTFSFVTTMPKLNYENKKVREYVLSVIQYWIDECGIDGWRFDVGNELSFEFYEELKQMLKQQREDLYLVAEIWHDSNRWLRNGYIDAAMNYSLCSPINEYAIYQTMDSAAFNQRYFHLLHRMSLIHNKMSFNLLDSHDTKRVMTLAGGAEQKVKNAFMMLFLFPGTPCIYYGTEIGLPGDDDPDNRRPMIWEEDHWNQSLLEFFRKLIAFRRRNSRMLQEAEIRFVRQDECDVWIFTGEQAVYSLISNTGGCIKEIEADKVLLTTTDKTACLEPGGMAIVAERNDSYYCLRTCSILTNTGGYL